MPNKKWECREILGIPIHNLAPQVGLEPTTLRLTAECSAIELLRNMRPMHGLRRRVRGAQDDFYNRRGMGRQARAKRGMRDEG
jgi:hypothetical protein